LNTNTFEDKRRENFERGRAELERRRLKMIESQISVLSEQLASSKKQVAEIKSKIDAMRSDRDTKAGLITSLEAQLQTVRSRKVFLEHEEQNLIAIAMDLNLVNSEHSNELDVKACQIKQEAISKMKDKLIELQNENEKKSLELSQINERLSESRDELKLVANEVTKIYEKYKEKLEEAKLVNQHLLSEKSKPINFEAAWGDPSPVEFSNAPVLSSDDPWVSSSIKQSPIATNSAPRDTFTFNEEGSGNSLGSKSKSVNNNDTYVKKSPDYSAFTDVGSIEPPTEVKDELKPIEGRNDVHGKKRFRAVYAFEARNLDELTINPGDIITVSEEVCEPGWLSGESNGRVGLFPEAYVEPIPSEFPQSKTSPDSPSCSETKFLESGADQSVFSDQTGSIVKYKVIYAFEARNPDELTISPGDIISGLDGPHEPGWLLGELYGQRGLFPEAYVEEFATEAPKTVVDQSSSQTTAGVSLSLDFL